MSVSRIAQTAGMDPKLIGQVLPWLFGTCSDMPALPVCVPASDALSVAMTTSDPPAGGTIKLSTRAAFDRFPDSGKFEVGTERGAWSGKQATTLELLNIARGSPAEAHPVGAAVVAQQDLHVYVVCENPRQGGYPIKSVSAVKVNGILKPASEFPVHTVNLNDTSIMPGTSVVSITFNMNPTAAVSSPYLWAGWATDPATGEYLRIEYHVGYYGSGATPPPTVVAPELITTELLKSVGVFGFVPGSFGPPPAPPPVAGPQIGVVTADVSGILDDATGTITGVAGQPLMTPAHIAKLILIEAYELTGFDAASWADTVTQQQSRGYTWACRFLPFSLDQVLAAFQLQGRAAIFRENGVWKSVFRKRGTVTRAFDVRTMVNPILGWSPIETILTAFDVTYAGGSQLEPLTIPRVESPTGLAKYGLRRGPLDLPWITTDAAALDLARYWLSLQDHQRLEGSCEAPGWEALPVSRYDLVEVDTAVTRAYSATRLPFRVSGARHDLDRRAVALSLSEDQDPAAELNAQYVVVSTQSL